MKVGNWTISLVISNNCFKYAPKWMVHYITFKFDFSTKNFWRGAHRTSSPDPSPRFFSGFVLGSGFALNSRVLRALDSCFALNFRLGTLVCPPPQINSWISQCYEYNKKNYCVSWWIEEKLKSISIGTDAVKYDVSLSIIIVIKFNTHRTKGRVNLPPGLLFAEPWQILKIPSVTFSKILSCTRPCNVFLDMTSPLDAVTSFWHSLVKNFMTFSVFRNFFKENWKNFKFYSSIKCFRGRGIQWWQVHRVS